MNKLPKLFVAVDDSKETDAWEKLKKIKDVSGEYGIKFNLDLVFDNLDVIRHFKAGFGKPLFIDLKMWNGKRTMGEVIKKLASCGIEMTNIYAHAATMLKDAVKIANDNGITILGVTVLTHYTEEYCQRVYGKSMSQSVRVLTEIALENGCHGVILPGTTLDAISDIQCIKFNPAVRPDWFEDKKTNVQEQIMSPGTAIKKGSTMVSCGSPIFKSPNPTQSFKLILDEINSA